MQSESTVQFLKVKQTIIIQFNYQKKRDKFIKQSKIKAQNYQIKDWKWHFVFRGLQA